MTLVQPRFTGDCYSMTWFNTRPKTRSMRVLLLEDEAPLADAVVTRLRAQGIAVDAVATIAAAETALLSATFDAAIFDRSLPDGDAMSLLRRLRTRGVPLPVLIATARDQISDRVAGLEAGADDYIVKPFDFDELLARLHAVIRRYEGNPNPVIRIGKYEINRFAHWLRADSELVDLTAKEWAVIEKLVAHPNSIVAREALETTLYSFDDDVGSNTVEVYVSRIRKKIGKDAIETVRGLGYRFTGH